MKYDLIVSLGGNCAAACQLRMRGLRYFSTPFDWLYMQGPETIEWLTEGFAAGYPDFCQKDNLGPIPGNDAYVGVAPYRYKDLKSGYCFIHHFHKASIENGGYDDVGNMMHRRINRFFKNIANARRVLFILATNFEYDLALAQKLVMSFRSRYPAVQMDFRFMQFGSSKDDEGVLEGHDENSRAEYFHYVRKIGDYDFSKTSCEWSFLDVLAINGKSLRKFSWLDKICYKVWKRMSRYMLEKGLACKGISFRNSRQFADSNSGN